MIILDENVFADQRQLLQKRKIPLRQIGFDLDKKGLTDEEIVSLLHQLSRPTFFTRDRDFFHRRLCHTRYCLVWLDVKPLAVADFVRRFLRHPDFRNRKNRLGKVIRVSPKGITFWQKNDRNVRARDLAETAARSASKKRAVDAAEPVAHFTVAEKVLRTRLSARGRPAGDVARANKTESITCHDSVNPKGRAELKRLFHNWPAGLVFVP